MMDNVFEMSVALLGRLYAGWLINPDHLRRLVVTLQWVLVHGGWSPVWQSLLVLTHLM